MSIPPKYANKTFKSCCSCKPTTVFIFCRDEAGNDITDFAVLREFYDKIEHKIEDYQLKRKGQPDFPARVGMQMMGWSAEQPMKSVIEYFNFDFQFAKSPEVVSFHNMFERGEDFFIADRRGVWSMYEDLYKPLEAKTLLGKLVTKIKYNADSVEVQTSDGWSYQADYALCTFSSGVLASDLVTFEPALPDWKKEAIYKNPMSQKSSGMITNISFSLPKSADVSLCGRICQDLGSFPFRVECC